MERYFVLGQQVAPPEGAVYHCQVCGEQLSWRDEIYTIGLGDTVAGCSCCLHGHNAAEWLGLLEE